MELVVPGIVLSIPVIFHYFKYRHSTLLKTQAGFRHIKVVQPVTVISTVEVLRQKTESILKERFIGLDLEWKPNQTKGTKPNPIAVMQIATIHEILIIQLLHLEGELPDNFKQFLEDKTVFKMGVGISADAKKLHRDHGIYLGGWVELGVLTNLPVFENIASTFGLKKLSEHLLGIQLVKNRETQVSDWSVHKLSKKQITYAAADGWVCLLLFERLMKPRLDEKNIELDFWWKQKNVCEYLSSILVDLHEIPIRGSGPKNTSTRSKSKPIDRKNPKFSSTACRKTPLYEGCSMLAPDGSLISYCNRDKLNWYLSKGLAEEVPNSDPPSIILKFRPSGKTGSETCLALETSMEIQSNANICVVCGSDKSYQKYYVVPRCYRQYFPKTAKFHCSHDVILLCQFCHLRCSAEEEIFKLRFVEEFNIPITGIGKKYVVNEELAKVAAAARELMRNKNKMSEARIKERTEILQNHFNISEELTPELIVEASKLSFRKVNPDHMSHGEAVALELSKDLAKLQYFQYQWRKFFEITFKPKFLPPYWDANHDWEEQHASGQRGTPIFTDPQL